MIFTVFPKTNDEFDLPQDFSTYEDALKYAEGKYKEDEYIIEPTSGDCV